MWNLLRCYLSGRHDYGVGCEPGTIFLRCVHCGHRSAGWTVDPRMATASHRAAPVPVPVPTTAPPRFDRVRPRLRVANAPRASARVIPFERSVAH